MEHEKTGRYTTLILIRIFIKTTDTTTVCHLVGYQERIPSVESDMLHVAEAAYTYTIVQE